MVLFLGGLGVHKFYLGQAGWRVAYALCCWTFIPAIVSFFEVIIHLLKSEDDWNRRYNPIWARPAA